MSQPRDANPAKLVVGIFLRDKALLADIAKLLQIAYGDLDMVSPWYEFDCTDYYTKEMGSPLYRRILVFGELIKQQALAEIKLHTNALEQTYAVDDNRRLNIDPGYLLHERFVLATGKNYSHRIYIGRGIYADLTLIYEKGEYRPLAWTYPDYSAEALRLFLLKVRAKYGADLSKG